MIWPLENLGLSTNDVIAFQSFDADHPYGKKLNSLFVCYQNTRLLTQIYSIHYEGNVFFWCTFHGKANDVL